jgi:hypothetical protein
MARACRIQSAVCKDGDFMVVWRSSMAVLCLVMAGCSGQGGATSAPSGKSTEPQIVAQPDTGEWKQHRLAGEGFAVMFPGAPTKDTSGSEGETTYLVEIKKAGDETVGFTVMYVDVGEIDPQEHEQRLENVRKDAVGTHKVVHDNAKVTVAGRPARDFAFVDENGDVQYYRVLIAGRRLYQVMVVSSESQFEATKADREKFLDSFELVD